MKRFNTSQAKRRRKKTKWKVFPLRQSILCSTSQVQFTLFLPLLPIGKTKASLWGKKKEMEKLTIQNSSQLLPALCSTKKGPTHNGFFFHLLMLTLGVSSAKPKWCKNWWKSYFQHRNCSNLPSNLPTAPVSELQIFGQFSPKKNLTGHLKLEIVPVEGLNRGIEKIQSNHGASMALLIK